MRILRELILAIYRELHMFRSLGALGFAKMDEAEDCSP